jgi:hypothetical protein
MWTMSSDFCFCMPYIAVALYINKIMKDFLKEDSNYKTVVKLSLISVSTLLMIFPQQQVLFQITSIIQYLQLHHPHHLQKVVLRTIQHLL